MARDVSDSTPNDTGSMSRFSYVLRRNLWLGSLPSHTFQMSIYCGQATAVGKTAMDCTRDIKLFKEILVKNGK